MGKITGIYPSMIRGSVGGYTYRQTKHGIIVSEKIAKGRRMPTLAQCRVRYKLTNLANFAAVLFAALRFGFEKGSGNEVAKFVAANRGMQPVFIPKCLAASRACVVVPCQMTSGSLPPVHNTLDDGNRLVSDIAVGTLAIGASTTVGELSGAIVANNPDWRDGDRLTLVVATQRVGGIPQRPVPVVELAKYEVTLGSGAEPLSTVIPSRLLASADGMLAMAAPLANQGAGFIHSRDVDGKTKVGTAFMAANNAETVSAYSSTEALIATANSYGGYREPSFLDTDPRSADTRVPDKGEAVPFYTGIQSVDIAEAPAAAPAPTAPTPVCAPAPTAAAPPPSVAAATPPSPAPPTSATARPNPRPRPSKTPPAAETTKTGTLVDNDAACPKRTYSPIGAKNTHIKQLNLMRGDLSQQDVRVPTARSSVPEDIIFGHNRGLPQ